MLLQNSGLVSFVSSRFFQIETYLQLMYSGKCIFDMPDILAVV